MLKNKVKITMKNSETKIIYTVLPYAVAMFPFDPRYIPQRCEICKNFNCMKIYFVPEGMKLNDFKHAVKNSEIAPESLMDNSCKQNLKSSFPNKCSGFKNGKPKEAIRYKYKGEIVQ